MRRLVCAALLLVFLTACGAAGPEAIPHADQEEPPADLSGMTLRILSGSENQELEEILDAFSQESGIRIEMTYQGSLDIMRALGQEDLAYDAVWPASSLWLNVGDTGHRVKHAESISITPVVFGIRKSLAESLGFVGREVSVQDLLDAIRHNKGGTNKDLAQFEKELLALIQKWDR